MVMGRNRCCGASMKPTWQVMSTVRAFAPFSPTTRLSAAQVARNEGARRRTIEEEEGSA